MIHNVSTSAIIVVVCASLSYYIIQQGRSDHKEYDEDDRVTAILSLRRTHKLAISHVSGSTRMQEEWAIPMQRIIDQMDVITQELPSMSTEYLVKKSKEFADIRHQLFVDSTSE